MKVSGINWKILIYGWGLGITTGYKKYLHVAGLLEIYFSSLNKLTQISENNFKNLLFNIGSVFNYQNTDRSGTLSTLLLEITSLISSLFYLKLCYMIIMIYFCSVLFRFSLIFPFYFSTRTALIFFQRFVH